MIVCVFCITLIVYCCPQVMTQQHTLLHRQAILLRATEPLTQADRNRLEVRAGLARCMSVVFDHFQDHVGLNVIQLDSDREHRCKAYNTQY